MRFLLLLSIPIAAATISCGNPFGLPAAIDSNVVDTVSLYALTGTPLTTPSAYRLADTTRVRVDMSTTFDFAFDIDTAGRSVLLPTGAIPIGVNSGLRKTDVPFDSIRVAPIGGYVLDSAVVVQAGTRVIAQSRAAPCYGGVSAYFYYAKLEVLAVDTLARRIDFVILVDRTCGYRGLTPGVPRR